MRDGRDRLQFTLQELAALRQLLNLAVMAKGIEVAQAALLLDQKIVAAVSAQTGRRTEASGDKGQRAGMG